MSGLTPVRRYIDALVHPSAQQDALTAARHRAFIAPRLIGSLAVLAAFPVYLTVRGAPSTLEVAMVGWLVVPILIACFLSRTGRYEVAHALSSLALSAFVVVVALKSGGIGSFAVIWLVVAPIEAALSASRRIVALASGLSLAAVALLLGLDAMHLVPASTVSAADLGTLTACAAVLAALYAIAVAFGAELLARTSVRLFSQEESRYRLLARNMTDVITRHGRHGAVLFASPAAEPLFGVPVRGLIGHGLFDRVHVADRPAFLKALSDAAACGEVQSVEFRVRRETAGDRNDSASGFIWIELRCRPLDGEAQDRQQPREVVAVMRDVTDRKAQEQALQDAWAEAERASTAKGDFLATMTHELRTPLNVIIGFSEMLTKQELVIDEARRNDYVQLINESGQHLLSVVNGILDMSKIGSGKFEITPEPFALDQAIATCCDLLALKAGEAGIALVRRFGSDMPEIVADKRAVNQILLNLLSNAIKFTNRGGQVKVASFRDGTSLAIVVEDTGVGIAADDLPRLGDPFFQARTSYNRRHDGTGLGLSIVKGLVGLHGGALDIRSELGIGTTVTVRLPIDCQPSGRNDALFERAQSRVIELITPLSTGAPVRKIA